MNYSKAFIGQFLFVLLFFTSGISAFFEFTPAEIKARKLWHEFAFDKNFRWADYVDKLAVILKGSRHGFYKEFVSVLKKNRQSTFRNLTIDMDREFKRMAQEQHKSLSSTLKKNPELHDLGVDMAHEFKRKKFNGDHIREFVTDVLWPEGDVHYGASVGPYHTILCRKIHEKSQKACENFYKAYKSTRSHE